MKFSVLGLCLLLASTMLLAQSNPIPFVNQPLVPSAVAPGGPSFTLAVNGTGFVSGATVNWNGTALSTTFVNSSQLTATVPAANVVNACTASITVSNPTPGGGTSTAQFLSVSNPTTLQFTKFQDNAVASAPPVVADFNGDGKLDFAESGETTGNGQYPLMVYLGNGDGTFSSSTYSQISLQSFAVGEFNGDRRLDLAGTVCDSTPTCYLKIFLGNGDGTFSAGTSVQTPFQVPGTPVIGDFNGDGKLDVALIAANSGLYVYLGNGDGTLQSPVISDPTTPYQSLVAVGDFNGDGKLDLIGFYFNFSDCELAFFAGNGDGTFQTPSTHYVLGPYTYGVAAADLNGDGKLDLVVTQSTLANGYTVMLGNGDGTFTSQAPGYAYPGLQSVNPTIADINADGKLDLILPCCQGGQTPTDQVFLGNGDGTFQTPVLLPFGTGDVVIGDFDNDGQPDLVTEGEYFFQGPGGGFSMSSGSSSATVSPGQTATYNLTIASTGGFSQKVSLSCSGAPSLSTCSVSPTSVALSGSSSTVTVSVTTTASSGSLLRITGAPPNRTFRFVTLIGMLVMLSLTSWIGLSSARRRFIPYGFAVLVLIAGAMTGCGGSSSTHSGGTPAGSYNLTVTGTSSSGSTTLTHTTKLTLLVQ